ncbi:MAG TPA: c-type cytochrome [Bacteroidia bacterium]|nr:c-type cytochrome [Bacteroidia bacterium]
MKKLILYGCAIAGLAVGIYSCGSHEEHEKAEAAEKAAGDSAAMALMSNESQIERGAYLVNMGGCDHCHSPKIMTDKGPQVDMSKRLSGRPADEPLAKIDQSQLAPGKWILASQDLTAWVGPWGVSFAANLSPDSGTGTGAWNEDLFIRIIRSGFHMGVEGGRPILPPMPWDSFAKMKDEDLKAVFAFIKSLPPIKNKVPDPLPPAGKS